MTEEQALSNSPCRLCSGVSVTGIRSIFASTESSGATLADQIWECLQIKVEKGDGLSESVCQPCTDTTLRLAEFRRACHNVQTELRKSRLSRPEEANEEPQPEVGADQSPEADADDQEFLTSENDDSVESRENGVSAEGELGEPTPDDYVLMKEETFSVDPNKSSAIGRGGRAGGVGAALGEHLVEFNNNSDVRDRDVLDTQRARNELLPPMWDVYEKHRPADGTGEVMVTHRRYIVSKSGFPCSLCGACFRFDQGHERGSRPSAADAAGPFDCVVCHKVFPKRSAWKKHQQTAHEDAKPFTCRECGGGFDRQEALARHLRLAHPRVPASPRPFACDACGRAYARKEHLQRHHVSSPMCVDPNAEPTRPFACPRCKQGFVRREHLSRHCLRAHDLRLDEEEPKPFGCDCGKTFTRREHLRRHKVTHCKDEKSVCVKTEPEDETPPASPGHVAGSNAGSGHAAGHPSSVRCDVCGKTFSRRSHVLRHMKRIHNTNIAGAEVYGCDVCHKQFGRKYHLERHRLSHHGQATRTEYECVTCGDKFEQTALLDSHMTAVHGNAAVDTFLWM